MTKRFEHIYWFAYYSTQSPSVRYRGIFPLNYMRDEHGIPFHFIIPSYRINLLFRFIWVYLYLLIFRPSSSLIVIQRVHSSFIYASLLKLLVLVNKNNTVYDLDDADYLTYSPRTIHYFMKNCRWVAAGSDEIKEYTENFNLHCMHLSSPTVELGIRKQFRNARFTIGWIGDYGGDHQKGLETFVFPAINKLNFPVKLVLIGVKTAKERRKILLQFNEGQDVQIEFIDIEDWTNEHSLQQHITCFDVGVATLLPTPIQLAKSGIKVKQYLNNGVPVISTDQPENARFIEHGVNGFLADSMEDFLLYFQLMKKLSLKEYQRMSKSAYDSRVLFNHSAYFEKLLQLTLRKPYPLKIVQNRPNNKARALSN